MKTFICICVLCARSGYTKYEKRMIIIGALESFIERKRKYGKSK